jgi:hypothetical protein
MPSHHIIFPSNVLLKSSAKLLESHPTLRVRNPLPLLPDIAGFREIKAIHCLKNLSSPPSFTPRDLDLVESLAHSRFLANAYILNR